ncbi:radical SAM protein [Candidatus Dojkabacteria bacterium]|jgi:MoaA/NifB/PqqE/SkfB family radical SAM enzyme|nr:radical SAM protein [Candidatus Dojkabacteria bacterium]
MKKFGKEEMTEKEFIRILTDIGKDYSGLIAPYLMCEPLLDKNICKKIKLIREMCPNASVEISTNGSLLTPKLAKELSETGITRVHFNVGGATKEVYEKRMKGLKFENTIKNIKYFRTLFPSVYINFVVHNDNKHQIEAIKELFKDFSVTTDYWASNRGGNLRIKNDGNTRFANCDLQNTDMYIMSNSDVIICCNDYMRTVVLGNLKKTNIWKLWDKRQPNFNHKICKLCH